MQCNILPFESIVVHAHITAAGAYCLFCQGSAVLAFPVREAHKFRI